MTMVYKLCRKSLLTLFVAAYLPVAHNAHAGEQGKMRGELSTYYLAAHLADTCSASMNEDEVDALSSAIEALENLLGLSTEEADRLYGDAAAVVEDIPQATLCDPAGKAMMAFRATLAKIVK